MIELKKSVPVVADVDVLIVGAGIAGATAAVAAGRNGAKTMVVDRFGCPGGNMGPGMVGGAGTLELPESMAEEGIPGIPGEFVKRCESYYDSRLLSHYFRDSQVVPYVWTQMMQEAGVQFMYNTCTGDPIMEGNRVVGLFVENKNGTQAIRAKVVVDATGDADVAARAGVPMDGGASIFAPGTYWAMGNVDVDRYFGAVSSPPDPEDVRWAESLDESMDRFHPSLTSMAKRQRMGGLFPYYRAAWESGEYKFIQDIDGLGYVLCDHGISHAAPRIGKYGILGAMACVWRRENPTSGDTEIMTALEVGTRNFIFETSQFLTRRVPGFEKAYLHIIAPYFNTRGGRSIISEYPVTLEDATQGREFDDVVFRACHRLLKIRPSKYESEYDFPYRQFLPQGVDGLMATGRSCIVQPPVMRIRWMVFLMGQATGAAAALAVQAGVTPRELDVKKLQSLLYNKYQAPLGDGERLKELGII
jgi:hypothetical protein